MSEQSIARDDQSAARPTPPTSTDSRPAEQVRPPDDDEVQGYMMRPPSLNEAGPDEEQLPAQT